MDKIKKIVSLDASTTCTGIGIYMGNLYNDSYIVETDKKIKGDDKLNQMISLIIEKLKAEKPDTVVCEKIVCVRNAQTTRMLQELTGAIRGFCIEHDIEYINLSPSIWRSVIVHTYKQKPGSRKREDQKVWALDIVNNKLGIITKSTDLAEAVLIGEAYVESR